MMRTRWTSTAALLLIAAAIPGCGGGSSGSSSNRGLSQEAQSAATGDIPDNQNFLAFAAPGFSIKYPEGWAKRGSGNDLTFSDKDNYVHVVVRVAPKPTAASITAGLAGAGNPASISLHGGRAIKVTYKTLSKPNPVTGKRVKETVDRYVLARGGRVATIDLGTPIGVDNVDAYKLMAESFQWR
jgi:hypothetical protein